MKYKSYNFLYEVERDDDNDFENAKNVYVRVCMALARYSNCVIIILPKEGNKHKLKLSFYISKEMERGYTNTDIAENLIKILGESLKYTELGKQQVSFIDIKHCEDSV